MEGLAPRVGLPKALRAGDCCLVTGLPAAGRDGGRPREARLGERGAPGSRSERPESPEKALRRRESRAGVICGRESPSLRPWSSGFRGGDLGSLLGNLTLLRDWARQRQSVLRSAPDYLGYRTAPYRQASFSDSSYSFGTEGYCV